MFSLFLAEGVDSNRKGVRDPLLLLWPVRRPIEIAIAHPLKGPKRAQLAALSWVPHARPHTRHFFGDSRRGNILVLSTLAIIPCNPISKSLTSSTSVRKIPLQISIIFPCVLFHLFPIEINSKESKCFYFIYPSTINCSSNSSFQLQVELRQNGGSAFYFIFLSLNENLSLNWKLQLSFNQNRIFFFFSIYISLFENILQGFFVERLSCLECPRCLKLPSKCIIFDNKNSRP